MKQKKNYWIAALALLLLVVGLVLQFTTGGQLSSGEYCMNYFAAGDYAVGVFAAGKFAVGIFTVGIFSIGIFSIGIFNIGIITVGIFVVGWRKRLPALFNKETVDENKNEHN